MALTRMILDVDMEDGTEHRNIKTNIADQMLYAKKARIEKWAGPADDPFTFATFMAFAALYRLGLYSKGFDDFCKEAAAVGPAGDEGEEIIPTKADQ